MRLLMIGLVLLRATAAAAAEPCADTTDYRVGAGIADITGPAGGLGMMGYAMPWQTTGGIHTRLWARAFVIESPCNGGRLAFVSADVGLLTQAVTRRVLDRLGSELGPRFDARNVILSATHTHSGPGAYSHYTLYNLSTFGFSEQNTAAVVDGITAAIVRAQAALTPATLRLAAGPVADTGINRSPPAYARNPAAERARYASDTDTTMTVLRVDAADGAPLGMISWFPVHATSMGNDNLLISGDNKGFASYVFERRMEADPSAPRPFVAAFAQSHEADVSPNIFGGTDGGGPDDFASTALSGGKQFAAAWALWEGATTRVRGPVESRATMVRMSAVAIEPAFADGTAHTTCPAAIGMSMYAGAEDGRGVGYEGFTCAPPDGLVERAVCALREDACQAPKPVALTMGSKDPPWSPDVLPFTLARVGSLAIAAVPFEMTTMAGRRLLAQVRETLAPLGVEQVVIAGLANAYAGYVVTAEEYAAQHYEGASTHFGPWTLAAVQQTFAGLAAALRDGRPAEPGPAPRVFEPWSWQLGVLFDAVPPGTAIGAVERDAAPSYRRGETASARFWGGHPQHDLQLGDTFLEIQRQTADGWQTVARDRDWETRFRWERDRCLPTLMCSLVTVEWDIPADAVPGTYRIRHDGHWKPLATRTVEPYEAYSRTFEVTAAAAGR